MLKEKSIDYTYREYKKDPLTKEELAQLLIQLGVSAAALLRKRDKMYKQLSLTGQEDDATLIGHFAAHPTLMERPIFIHNNKAVVCRPYTRLLELL